MLFLLGRQPHKDREADPGIQWRHRSSRCHSL